MPQVRKKKYRKGYSKKSRSGVSYGNTTAIFSVTLISCFYLVDSLGCANNPTITTDLSTCTYSGSTLTCQLQYELLFSISTPGLTSCYTFMSPAGEIIAVMNLTYLAHQMTVVPEFLYWTSDWSGQVESEKWCYTPSNDCGGTCDNMAATDNTGNGHLTNPFVTLCPGYTKCYRPDGCISNGCFYCTAQCQVQRFAARPIGPVYSVYTAAGYDHSFLLQVDFYTYNAGVLSQLTTSTVKASYEATAVDSYGFFNLDMVGSFLPKVNYYIPNYAFAATVSNIGAVTPSLMSTFSNRKVPLPSQLGDLQGNNENSFLCDVNTISQTSLSTDVAIVNSPSSVTFKPSGIISSLTLPAIVNQNLWSKVGSSIYTNLSSASPILLRLYTLAPITVSRTVTTVCPSIEYVNTTGCYNCDLGFRIWFLLLSTCLPGEVYVSSNGCTDQVFPATTTNVLQFLTCFSSERAITNVVTAIADLNNSNFTINSLLDYVSPDVALNLTTVTDNGEEPTSISSADFSLASDFF